MLKNDNNDDFCDTSDEYGHRMKIHRMRKETTLCLIATNHLQLRESSERTYYTKATKYTICMTLYFQNCATFNIVKTWWADELIKAEWRIYASKNYGSIALAEQATKPLTKINSGLLLIGPLGNDVNEI